MKQGRRGQEKKEFILYFLQSILHTLSFRSLPRVFPFSSTCFSLIVEKEFEKRKKEIKKRERISVFYLGIYLPFFVFRKKEKKSYKTQQRGKYYFPLCFRVTLNWPYQQPNPPEKGFWLNSSWRRGRIFLSFFFIYALLFLKGIWKKKKERF